MKRIWRWLLLGVLVAGAAGLGLMEWAARELASPPRRVMEDYHHEMLATPDAFGLRIAEYSLADGTPCLLCRPDPEGGLGERGRLIRNQIAGRQPDLMLPEAGTENGATLVLLHGRRGRKEDNLPVAARFCALGFRCVLVDLPAHGENPERRATYGMREAGVPLMALEEAGRHFGFATDSAGVWGISMGGSVANHAVAEDPDRWGCLVVVASFDTLEDVVRRQCAGWLGERVGAWMQGRVAWRYRTLTGVNLAGVRPVDRCASITCPMMVAHGDDDPLIPVEAGRSLLRAAPAREKQWVFVADGTHGNVLVTAQPLYAEMAEWFLRHLAGL